MPEEILAEVETAPTMDVTATPESAEVMPEVEQPAEPPAVKTFTQEELDAAIGKRLAREQRKWEREQSAKAAETRVLQAPSADLAADQFESPEAYAEQLALQKAEELIQQRVMAKRQAEVAEAYHEREEEVRAKYDDFEQVAYNPKLPITEVMAEAIRYSDIGPELAYHLGSNPKEADRISKLAPLAQARELGKLEAKLVDSPPAKKATSAPAPILPVSARSAGTRVLDTTDPRSIASMTDSQWIEAERARQRKKLQAQMNT